MGILKRSTMTLLTTLAALIIIVHCVEEDLEDEYQHDFQPRILDTRQSAFDENWGEREATSMLERPRRTEDWKETLLDEPLKRRKFGRKRKRRPQTTADDFEPQEEIPYPDEPPRPYHDFDAEKTHELLELPKLRRKKPEDMPVRWGDDDLTVIERPLRKKSGPRKSRPSLQDSPDSNEYREIPEINQDVPDIKKGKERADSDQILHPENTFDNTPELKDETTKNVKSENNIELKEPGSETINTEQIAKSHIDEDKSLSELSMETTNNAGTSKPKFKFPRRYKSKSSNVLQEHEKGKETVDPLTLKDILKRSNGSSLSEILQQHNLSLTDLLHGKEQAVSIFKNLESTEDQKKGSSEHTNTVPEKPIETEADVKENSEEPTLIKSESKYVTEPVIESVTENLITTDAPQAEILNEKEVQADATTTAKPLVENTTKIRRRFPLGLRKKLRPKPVINVSTTQKAQLSRDLITLNNRKYTQLRRNTTKSKEWKDIISKKQNKQDTNTTTLEPETTTQLITSEDTTIVVDYENKMSSSEEIRPQANIDNNLANIDMDVTEATSPVSEITTEVLKYSTDKPPGIVPMTRPTAVSLGLRRTVLNNRLKRKRLKQKNATTESPQDDLLKHLYGMGNLVSSSEFIAKTEQPKTTQDDSKYSTTLQDFLTTESLKTTTDEPTQTETIFTTETTPKATTLKTTTQEPAKVEIEEILNDTQILSKLSNILTERNMTLEELIAHRERGSSHIHLADIFHNNSRDPTPPEPFLTKSILEPMSKETYPLRVLLDANSHDPNVKATTMDPEQSENYNIPIAMDFGNNVNENAENMGIMSLFNEYTKNITDNLLPPPSMDSQTSKDSQTFKDSQTSKDSQTFNDSQTSKDSHTSIDSQTSKDSQNYKYSETSKDLDEKTLDSVHNVTNANDTVRESRVLEKTEDNVVNWNEILALMSAPKNNETEEILLETPFKKLTLQDIDDEGLMMLEDLQRLKDFDNPMGSQLNGNIELNFGNLEPESQGKSFLDNVPSQTTSVTVVTASIVGLGMILFLLTYIAFKWRQQRSISSKSSFSEERISTPVFETRKGHKNNSSMRSISPMMQPSSIYAVSNLDSHHCDESGEYIWDSMRQPYQ